jgi:hypothetical protein
LTGVDIRAKISTAIDIKPAAVADDDRLHDGRFTREVASLSCCAA